MAYNDLVAIGSSFVVADLQPNKRKIRYNSESRQVRIGRKQSMSCRPHNSKCGTAPHRTVPEDVKPAVRGQPLRLPKIALGWSAPRGSSRESKGARGSALVKIGCTRGGAGGA